MEKTLLLIASLVLGSACAHSGLTRQLAESVHRDYPNCGGHEMRGHPLDEAAGTWAVDACGVATTYQCPTGPHSRWRFHGCQQLQGGAVVVAP